MGEALLSGWLAGGFSPETFLVSDPFAAKYNSHPSWQGVRFHIPESLPASLTPSVMFIAVKPQQFDAVLTGLRPLVANDTLIISIAAGKGLDAVATLLGEEVAAVRAMPNTPALIRQGVTVACPNPRVSPAQRQTAEALLGSVGAMFWVEDEALLDPVTALSGSGPAYVFLFLEWLTEAAAAAGLPAPLARELAQLTVSGSAALAAHDPSLSLAALRKNVTSPGGTTEAALEVLEADTLLRERFHAALQAATGRAAALRKI